MPQLFYNILAQPWLIDSWQLDTDMDHIPNIYRPALGHIQVPCLLSKEYRCDYADKDFFSFPERHGWDLCAIMRRDFKRNGLETPLRAASLLQAWLYFGFMSEVLKTEVLIRDFLEEIDGQEVITTKSLPRYINNWQDEIISLPEIVKEEKFHSTLEFFGEVDVYFNAATQNPPGKPHSPLPPEVRLSISVLHATLYFAMMHIFRNEDDPSPSNPKEFIHGFPIDFIETRLRGQGWCPSDIELLKNGGLGSTSILELYYAYLLGNRDVIRDHSGCESTFIGRFACTAFNITEDDYKPAHVAGCSRDCRAIEVDQSWLEQVTQVGRLPLITISTDKSGAAYLEARDSDYNADYAAISHVYADGLGNPRKCALPTCQLTRLQSRVNLLNNKRSAAATDSANLPFWMDTLCIPVRSDMDDVRKTAVRNMAMIYRRAQVVLVLNAELENHSCHASSEEIAMRVSTCSWFRRLWTLQEGVLACNLYFQFQDGAVNLESQGLSCAGHGKRFSVRRRIQAQAIKPYTRICAFRKMPRERRIREIYTLTHWRTTSKDEDEPYCLATLLLADQMVLQRITATKYFYKRREEFIMGQGLFPVKTLFFLEVRVGTRDPPIGWALRRYLYRSEPEPVPASDPLALVDEAGWHVHLSGITCSVSDLPVKPAEGHRLPDFTITDDNKDIDLELSSCFWLRDQNPPEDWRGVLSAFGALKIGIIIEQWPLNYHVRHDGFTSFSPTRGAVIAITKETTSKFTGFFCGTVVISRVGSGQTSSHEILLDMLSGFDVFQQEGSPPVHHVLQRPKLRKDAIPISGQLFDESWEWCIM